jgi:hypothetical protein
MDVTERSAFSVISDAVTIIRTGHVMQHDRDTARLFARDAWVSFVVLVLAFAAFDDITTDNATSFRFEYTALAICALWLGSMAVRLLRFGYQTPGIVSLAVLAAALWGQRTIGPGSTVGFWSGYVVTMGAFLWFLALAICLLVLGCRTRCSA